MIKLIRSKKGDGWIYSVAIVLICFMIFAVVAEYLRVSIILSKIKENIEIAVTTTVVNNSETAFGGVREGVASLYERGDAGYEEVMDTNDVYDKISATFAVVPIENGLEQCDADGNLNFRISDLTVETLNPEINAETGTGVRFRTTYVVTVLMFGLEEDVFPINIPQTTTSTYKPIF